MPVIIVFLLVAGLVYQMLFRYETSSDPKHKGFYYEHDNLTGETRRVERSRVSKFQPLSEDEPASEDDGWGNSVEESASDPDPFYSDERSDDFYSDIPVGHIVKTQEPEEQTEQPKEQPRESNRKRYVADTPERNRVEHTPVTAQPEKHPLSSSKHKASVSPKSISKEKPPTLKKPTQTASSSPLRQGVIETIVNPPAKIMVASASTSAPIPQNGIRKATGSSPEAEDGRDYAINKIDLDRDGIGERLIQNASRHDGQLDFSIVKGEREVFFATGRQLIFLSTSHHGWQDIVINTGRQRIVYRYNNAQGIYEAI